MYNKLPFNLLGTTRVRGGVHGPVVFRRGHPPPPGQKHGRHGPDHHDQRPEQSHTRHPGEQGRFGQITGNLATYYSSNVAISRIFEISKIIGNFGTTTVTTI